jgi:hypothetical protein
MISIISGIFLSNHVGRSSPRTASLLRPPLFNFSETYKDGRVLVFEVGMSKRELHNVVFSDSRIKIDPSCWGDYRAGGAKFYSRGQIANALRDNSVICVDYAEEGFLTIKTVGETVTEIQSYYIRTELL